MCGSACSDCCLYGLNELSYQESSRQYIGLRKVVELVALFVVAVAMHAVVAPKDGPHQATFVRSKRQYSNSQCDPVENVHLF